MAAVCAALALLACAPAAQVAGDLTVKVVSPPPGATPAAGATRSPAAPNATPSARASDGGAGSAKPSARPSGAATPRPADVPPLGGSLADVAAAATQPVKALHRLRYETTKGDFAVALFPERAPRACAKVLALVGAGVYDGTTFHRVIAGYVAQGGDPTSKDKPYTDATIGFGTFGEPVPDDFQNGLKHLPGSVALAHASGPNTSSCQFYVCLSRLADLDDKYIVFGQVVTGFDVVQALTVTEQDNARLGVEPDRLKRVVQED